MSENDRWVDLVQEGVDCVLRYGKLRDSELVARQVATLERIVCATPAYLRRYGTPADLAALDGHQMVGLRMGTTDNLMPMEFGAGADVQGVTLPCAMSVTGTESYLCAIRLGLGIAQVPRFHVEPDLHSGALVQVLAHIPQPAMPVSLVYQRTRQLSPRVRVFIDWAVREFANRHAPAAGDSIGA
ncbi:MAG TPA: LysR substrate-binding domain-containing protein [Paraburkholderia sp.]|nr:LysR substrate-binding domain-containing protein [Paraburkholderia sp.]